MSNPTIPISLDPRKPAAKIDHPDKTCWIAATDDLACFTICTGRWRDTRPMDRLPDLLRFYDYLAKKRPQRYEPARAMIAAFSEAVARHGQEAPA